MSASGETVRNARRATQSSLSVSKRPKAQKFASKHLITVTGKAFYDIAHAPADHSNRRSKLEGFSGLANEKLTPELKRTWGPLAYLRSAAAALPQLRSYRTAVRLGTKETFSVDVYNVVIANGRFVAGGLPIAPNADPSDGVLDIILIPERLGSEISLLAAKIVLGNHLDADAVTFRRAARVSIKSRPGMWFTVDGELIGNDPIVFDVMPRALQFVVGKR